MMASNFSCSPTTHKRIDKITIMYNNTLKCHLVLYDIVIYQNVS